MRNRISIIAVLGGVLAAQTLQRAVEDFEAGRLEKAEAALTVILRDKPDSADAHYYLGLVHFRANRPAAARPYLERAVKLSPMHVPAWKALGLVVAASGDLKQSLAPFGEACRLAPRDPDACYYFARNLYALQRYDLACRPFEQALEAAPPSMRAKVERAAALNMEALGRSAEAERHFRQAIELQKPEAPPHEDPRVDYGAFLFRQGRAEEALHSLEGAAAALASSSRANAELGRVLLELGKTEAATTPLLKAIALEPGNWTARLLLGRAFLRLGRQKEGEEQMRLGQEGWARQHSDSSIVK